MELHHHIGVTSNYLIKTKLIKVLFKNADVSIAQIYYYNIASAKTKKLKLEKQQQKKKEKKKLKAPATSMEVL